MEEGANVMIMIGCDFHPGLEELALLDTETGRRREHGLSHSFGSGPVREFYAGLGQPVRVGLEASGYSQWFEEMLEELGIELWVGDPARIRKAAPRKQKTDRNDARLLLQLLEENRFPRIWVPDRATRDLRQLLMHRHKLVTMRSSISQPAAGHRAQPGRAEEEGAVEQGGPRAAEVAPAAALDHAAAGRVAGAARTVGCRDRRTRQGGAARGRRPCRGPLSDAPSAGSRAHHRTGGGPQSGSSGALPLRQESGQLRGPGSGRVLQRRPATAGPYQQRRQPLPALVAGGGGHGRGAPRPGVETGVLEAGGGARQSHRQSGGGPQTAHPPVLDVAPAKPKPNRSPA